MKVLIVDDEKGIIDVINEYCKNEGYNTDYALNGTEALKKLNENLYDILILDVMMPIMDGFTMLKRLSPQKRIPTIVLSARSEEYDKLEGFSLGIDDYVTKPFSPKELIARIKAVTNRHIDTGNTYKYETLEVGFKSRVIKIDGKKIDVTPKEFEILEYLIKNKGNAVSREMLLSTIWGYDFFGDVRTVDTHIKMLRNSLGKYRNLIETVRGLGYKFNDED